MRAELAQAKSKLSERKLIDRAKGILLKEKKLSEEQAYRLLRKLALAYRWFCHLGLEDTIPDHSTFSKNRHGRFRESDTFRHVFENVLSRCMAEGLVGGEGFAIDASLVKADANRARGVPGEQAMDWKSGTGATRAVREYLVAIEEGNPIVSRSPPTRATSTCVRARLNFSIRSSSRSRHDQGPIAVRHSRTD
jgi:IS5 family transposase